MFALCRAYAIKRSWGHAGQVQSVDVMLWPADDMLTLLRAPNKCKLISTSETRKVIYADLIFMDAKNWSGDLRISRELVG